MVEILKFFGFDKWYCPPGNPVITTARTNFCNSVTDTKNKVDFRNVDFYPGLFFKKVLDEMGEDGTWDATFDPGVNGSVNKC